MSASTTSSAPPSPIGTVRWRIPLVLLVSVFIAYLDRLNISLALPQIAAELGWSTEEMGRGGLLMGIFFAGYGLANIVLSPLGEKHGPRRSLMVAVVLFSLFTMAGAAVGHLFGLFLLTRLLLGLGEGIHFPMASTLTKSWFPESERSRANAIWVAGVLVATFSAPLLLVPIIERFGWRAMFVALGVGGMVITLPLLKRFCHDTPRDSPSVGPAELAHIEADQEREPERVGFWNQVRPFLKDRAYWIALAAGVGNNFAAYGLIMWFPIYFTEGRGLEYDKLSYALPVQYGFGLLGIAAASWLGDRTRRRTLLAGVGYLLTAALAFLATRASSIPLTVALFSAAVFFQMSYTAQEFAILQRILPRSRVGTGTGLYNGVAMFVGGGLGSWMVGATVAATGSYDAGLGVLVAVAGLTGATMIVLSRILRY